VVPGSADSDQSEHENLYNRILAAFDSAIRGQWTAFGKDDVRSLAASIGSHE